jgi:triosephosphate isomerase
VGRKPLIAGNWKMNLTHLEAIALMQKFAFALPEKYYDKVEVAVLPPFTHIRSIQTMIDGDGLAMVHGAQDLSPHDAGAYTGDVSGVMLAKLGCRYVIVGHSERRAYHGETDDLVNGKVRAAIRNGIAPILCVGEGLSVRETGEQVAILLGPAHRGAGEGSPPSGEGPRRGVRTDLGHRHRPVASPASAQEVCAALRAPSSLYGDEHAAGTRILYGGSVKANNVAELMRARTSTARSWAERASTSRSSRRSARCRGRALPGGDVGSRRVTWRARDENEDVGCNSLYRSY